MNRRAFCLSLAAVACSGGEKRRRSRAPHDAGPTPDGHVTVDRVTPYVHRARRSPLELHGDTLAQRTPGGIVVWDTLAMKPIATHDIAHASACFTHDGRLAALASVDGRYVMHLIGRTGMRTVQCPELGKPGVLLPARDTSYFVVRGDDVIVLEELRGRIEHAGTLTVSAKPHLAYSADGRLVVAGKAMHVVDGTAVKTYAMQRRPLHVAAMPNDRCWLATANADERIDTLELVAIAAPDSVERTVTLPTEHVLHLATSPAGELAALVLWIDRYEERWAILVLDPQGRERTRIDVPRSHAGPQLTSAGFVAISAKRVVLHGLHESLLAWDAATGKLV